MFGRKKNEVSQRAHTVFHKLWGHCKESPEYDKKLWMELEGILTVGDQPTLEAIELLILCEWTDPERGICMVCGRIVTAGHARNCRLHKFFEKYVPDISRERWELIKRLREKSKDVKDWPESMKKMLDSKDY